MKKVKLVNVVNKIIALAKSDTFKEDYRMTKKDFTRNRKLSFFDNIMLIMQCSKCSIQSRINMFLRSRNEYNMEYSKQAFSKGRHRIKPEAFKVLMETAAQSFYEDGNFNTFDNYLLLSIDGSDYNLPNSADLLDYFGSQPFKDHTQVQAQTSCLYDVLNGVVLEAEIEPHNANERALAITHLKNFRSKTDAKAIVLMDRGYPAFDLINDMEKLKINYLMRCNKDNFLKEIRDAKSGDQIVHIKRKGIELYIRVVTIKIKDDAVTFITNLNDIDISTIEKLYHKRWDVETLYNKLKNRMEIENFSGLDELCVKQDFYTTLLLSNMAACAIFESQKELDNTCKKKELSKEYRINHTYAVSELKMRLIELVYTESHLKQMRISRYIHKALKKNVVLYQPERINERKRKYPCIKCPVNMKKTIR